LASNLSNPLLPGHTNTPLGASTTLVGDKRQTSTIWRDIFPYKEPIKGISLEVFRFTSFAQPNDDRLTFWWLGFHEAVGFFADDFFASGKFVVGSSDLHEWRGGGSLGSRCPGWPVAMPQSSWTLDRRVAQRVFRVGLIALSCVGSVDFDAWTPNRRPFLASPHAIPPRMGA
jgi:hypothetical protein